MREEIRDASAVLALGNWLNLRGKKHPHWITRNTSGTHDGYDLYRPSQMDFGEYLDYESVLKMAKKSEFVRIME
jgi:hypothetical protein